MQKIEKDLDEVIHKFYANLLKKEKDALKGIIVSKLTQEYNNYTNIKLIKKNPTKIEGSDMYLFPT